METGNYFWFPWYPECYRLDTQHLTAEQDGIYRRLIDYYMESRQPLPDSDIALARIAGVGMDAWGMAAAIVRAFFYPSENVKLHHKRCDLELDRQDGLLRKQSEKGKKGAKARWENKKRKQDDNSSGHASANASAIPELWPDDATETETETKKEKNTKKENPIIPDWIPKAEWDAWLECRKQKRIPNTVHALKLAISNLEKLRTTGNDPAAVLNQSIMRGYAGLFEVKQVHGANATPAATAHNPHREVA